MAKAMLTPLPQAAFMSSGQNFKDKENMVKDSKRTTNGDFRGTAGKNTAESILAKDDHGIDRSEDAMNRSTTAQLKNEHERTTTEYIKDAADMVKDATINAGHKIRETAGKAASAATTMAHDATESAVKNIQDKEESQKKSSSVRKAQAKEVANETSSDNKSVDTNDFEEEDHATQEKYQQKRDQLFDYMSEVTVAGQEAKQSDTKAASDATYIESQHPIQNKFRGEQVGKMAKNAAERATTKSSKTSATTGLKETAGSYAGYGNSSGTTHGKAPAGYGSSPNASDKAPKMAENPSMKDSEIPSYGYASEDWVDKDKVAAPIKSGFESEREAMGSLVSRGFIEKFTLSNNKVVSGSGNSYDLKFVSIMEVHGFQQNNYHDSSKDRVYLAIEAKSNDSTCKGVIETTYDKLNSPEIQTLIERAKDEREGVKKQD